MLTFKQIKYGDTKPLLLKKHYAHRMPSISYAYGVFDDTGILQGIVTFGEPASHSLVIGVAGEKNSHHVIELNRLYINEEFASSNHDVASQLVSFGLKQLKKYNKIVVSYADSGMNHIGYVYQACNFMYTGKTKSRTDIFAGIGKHSRHYKKGKDNYYRVYRSSKYRYIYICGDKRFKKSILKDINYKQQEYPKGETKHYKVGQTKPTILIGKDGSKKILDKA